MTPPRDKSILFISYWYAPMQGMGVHRVLSACSNFRLKGFDVRVLTSRNRSLVRHDDYHEQAVEAEEVHAFDFRFWHAWLTNRSPEVKPSSVKKQLWYRWFVKCNQSFPLDMIFGEGGITYILNGIVRASRVVREREVTHIYSSYGPMADHWIAAIVKYLNPKLYWIADFRDQHVDRYRANTFVPRLQRWVDRQILKKADRVTTVSHGMASQLEYLNRPISVVYNDHRVYHPARESAHPKATFDITYTGSLYPWQHLDALCRIIGALESEFSDILQLIYAGRDGGEWDSRLKAYGLLKMSRNEGLVNHQKALKLQKEADLNVLLTWNQKGSRGVLTGKLFEYIRSGRPLLVLINGETDPEMRAILEKGEVPFHIHSSGEDHKALYAFIRDLILCKSQRAKNLVEEARY